MQHFSSSLYSEINGTKYRIRILHLETTETVVFHAEGGVDNLRDVIGQHPAEGAEEVRVHRLNVRQVDGLVEQHLVERHREPAVNVVSVKDGNS
jgi:hypothetical protein